MEVILQLHLHSLLSLNSKLFIINMQRELTTILYIDDDQDDLLIFEESVGALYPDVTLYKAQSSEAGIQILDQLEKEKKPFPSLIMIDMNMPKMDGRQTLQHIRENKKWRNIPVAIFTTSANKEDIEFCKSFGSACITKPMSYADFSATLKKLFSHSKIITEK
ncbi:MAG TPA: response regulator [Niastella sp.]|nr:response regulator [Niastella sp.]